MTKIKKHLLVTSVGAAAGQFITILFSPILTRIYSPELYGVQGVFLSIVSVISAFIAFRYPMAIMIAKNERQVDYISKSSIILAAIFAITLSTSLIFVQFVFPNTTVADQLGWLITLTPIAAFMITIQEVNEYKAARKNAFTLTAAAAVTQSMLSNSARVAAGLVAPTAYPLIIISTLAPAINSIIISSVTADPKKKNQAF